MEDKRDENSHQARGNSTSLLFLTRDELLIVSSANPDQNRAKQNKTYPKMKTTRGTPFRPADTVHIRKRERQKKEKKRRQEMWK